MKMLFIETVKLAFAGLGVAVVIFYLQPTLLRSHNAPNVPPVIQTTCGLVKDNASGQTIETLIEAQNNKLSNGFEKNLLNSMGEILINMQSVGDIELSKRAAKKLIKRTASAIALSPLSRNIIYKRQFELPIGKSYSIFGSPTTVVFLGKCKDLIYRFSFNSRPPSCLRVGGRVGANYFVIDDKKYKLVFDSVKSDEEIAEFTIHPVVNSEVQEK